MKIVLTGWPGVLICVAMAVAAPLPQAGGSVEGRVTSTVNGAPVGKATVTLRGLVEEGGGPAETYLCETDSNGRFHIAGVAPGRYDLRPSRTGYETRSNDRFAAKGEFPEYNIAAGQRLADIELHLTPDGVLAGKVLTADGDPMRHVNVQAMQYRYISGKKQLSTTRAANTDDRGEFRLFDLAPGRYYLRAIPNNRFMPNPGAVVQGQKQTENFAPAFYPNAFDPAQSLPLNLAAGGELDGVDFRLSLAPTYTIRGKISGTKANGGWNVMAQRRSSDNMAGFGPQTRIINGPDGPGYEIVNLLPGSYVVTGVTFEGRPGESQSYARQIVEVGNRDVDGVDLTFAPTVQLAGTVKVEGPGALQLGTLRLSLIPEDQTSYANFTQPATVSPDGSFTMKGVVPDTYRLRLVSGDAYVKSIKVGDRELEDRKIDAERISGALTLVLGTDTGSVTGSVADADGKPAFNANVTLIPDQRQSDWPQRFKNVFTDGRGNFTFKGVVPGEYKLFAWYAVEPGAPQDAEFRKPYEDQGVTVRVASSGQAKAQVKVVQTAPPPARN